MELLLNLIWVGLAVSALYAWGCRRGHSRSRPHLIALVCVLALLFPVISATDDLHAMRPEMEDSASSKRSLKQVVAGKAFGQNTIHNPPALLISASVILSLSKAFSEVVPTPAPGFFACSRSVQCDRAPPVPELL